MTKDTSSFRKPGEAIAIIGLSCLFPGAENKVGYWAAIKKSLNAISDIPEGHWATADYYDADPKAEDKTYGRRGGFISPVAFEPLKYGIVPNDLSAIDTTQLLGLVAADMALADSGYASDSGHDHSRTAVMLGVTGALKMVVSLGSRLAHPQLRRALDQSGVDAEVATEVLKRFANEFAPWQENSFPGLLGNVTSGRIANRLDLGGSNLVVDAACASSLAAVRQGLMELVSGQADLVVTGGVDTFSDPFMYTCFSKTPALSPTGQVKAYDKDGDGTMLGEGIGIVVLKRLSDAQKDGDRIYAVIKGVGSSSDGKGTAIFAPTAEGQARALKNAYENAGISPDTVELVEGHGTGTAVGDAVEVAALSEAFSGSQRAATGQPWCALGSVKSQIGHTKAAAGAAGLIKAALALHYKALPPNVNVETPLPILTAPGSPFHLSTKARPWLSSGPRRAGVSAFGFGGSNFHCLLEEAAPLKPMVESPLYFEFFAFSGQTTAELADNIRRDLLSGQPVEMTAAKSRASFSSSASHRLVILATISDFSVIGQRVIETLANPNFVQSDFPENSFYGSGQTAVKNYGFLLPGVSSAYQDMFRELASDWPQLHQPLSGATQKWAEIAPSQPPLDLLLYPPDLVSPVLSQSWTNAFADARPRTLALDAIYQGLKEIFELFELKPAAVIDGLKDQIDLAKELKKYQNIGLWLEIGPGGTMSRAAKEILEEKSILTLDLNGGTHLDLARLLTRLAVLGLPLNLAAWPYAAAPESENSSGQSFTTMISGANHFVKKDLPIAPRRQKEVKAAAEGKLSAISLLETMAAETTKLHQDFLNHQSEMLRVISKSLETPASYTPMAAPAVSVAGHMPMPIAASDTFAADPPANAEKSPSRAPATEAVLRVVSDETGYPLEMLNLDMDLESDLGLDSIKKVEIMAILSEKMPSVQGLGAETMNNASTLRDLVSLVGGEKAVQPAVPKPTNQVEIGSGIWPVLRDVVSAETGYPKDMLSPQMRLGDDLGLDSIKLVEIASVMSERLPDASAVSAEVLNDAQTLEDLAAALEKSQSRVRVAQSASIETTLPAVPRPSSSGGPAEVILEVVSQETGYPKDMLNMSMNLEADLGLDSIKKVEIMAALSERLPQVEALTTADVMSSLETLGDLAALAGGGAPSAVAAPFASPSKVEASPSPSKVSVSCGDLLLEVVATETGYPKDMLSFDAALEADLGLDSIKRVEIMASLSEKMGDSGLASAELLNDAVTLGDLRDLLSKSIPEKASSAAPQISQPIEKKVIKETVKRRAGRPLKSSVASFKVVEQDSTADMITSSLSSFKVDMVPVSVNAHENKTAGLRSQAKVIILSDQCPMAEELSSLFMKLGQQPEIVGWLDLARLKFETGVEALIITWPPDQNSLDMPKAAFTALKFLAPSLLSAAEQGYSPLVMGLTFMGGSFGFASDSTIKAPVCGALGGLMKTAAREWPGVRVRSVDLPLNAYQKIADYLPGLLNATSSGAPLETGLTAGGQLMTPALSPYKSKNIRVRHLREGQTLLVTGGARGVTAAALKELAKSLKPHLVILGRTPMPAEEPAWVKNLTDETAIRQALFEQAKDKPNPKELARQSSSIISGREIKDNLAAMEKAGAKVTYISGDFENLKTVKATLDEIKISHGPIHGFLHGAGVLADSLIVDKSDHDFDSVFDTKARMAEQILAELAGQPLNFIAFFSSSTARFGRKGQADYAAGNEVLNKLARAMSGGKNSPKCLSINWGPWAGGMVDAGLSRLFESEGIGLIPLVEGARLFVSLASSPKNDPVEIVVLGPNTNLGALKD